MTIAEAMNAVSDDYDAETERASKDPRLKRLLMERLYEEWKEIDKELPGILAACAKDSVPDGTVLPDWIYVAARLVFRLGMRVQRKLDHPTEPSTAFWGDGKRAAN